MASTITRSRPARGFLMLGSVIYHRTVLIRIIREELVGVWNTLLAHKKAMAVPERTENLDQYAAIAVVVLDAYYPFSEQCVDSRVAVVPLIRRV